MCACMPACVHTWVSTAHQRVLIIIYFKRHGLYAMGVCIQECNRGPHTHILLNMLMNVGEQVPGLHPTTTQVTVQYSQGLCIHIPGHITVVFHSPGGWKVFYFIQHPFADANSIQKEKATSVHGSLGSKNILHTHPEHSLV